MNITKLTGPGDEEPQDEMVTCSICERTVPVDFFVDGYLFPTCDDCDEAISAELEKEEDGQ